MIYRQEHPKPQFQRDNWLNLNGKWQFEIDFGDSGEAQGFHQTADAFSKTIEVPFCVESRLSGVGYTDFMRSVWYKREVTLTPEQVSGRVILHFGAVDYKATVYVNGEKCCVHKGGYVSFRVDVTPYVHEGENTIVVNAQDDTRSGMIPSGKQSDRFASYGCSYTRTTGIWQTVWMEFVPETYLVSAKYLTDAEKGSITIHAKTVGNATFTAEAFFEGQSMGKVSAEGRGDQLTVTLPLSERHLWEVGKGGLYDLTLTYGDDVVHSYVGLRSLALDGYAFRINGKAVFQRLILDQGFYPDGIYTAPSDAELLGDIERSLAMGFNGARLHEKVFEERFLYHCDRLGYIVWGEYPNWGLDHTCPESIYGILPEWLEEVERDFNHPSIVGWCPFNETWDANGKQQYNDLLAMVYKATKAADPTRPCIDTSGNFHVITDIFDVHNYDQDVKKFADSYRSLAEDGTLFDHFANRQTYVVGQPTFVSEYGGIRWTEDGDGWGYGDAPQTPEDYLERLKGLTDVLLDNPRMLGLCYTQLTDVEQEQNGLYTYDRRPKFDPAIIHAIFSRKAAIEEE